MIRFALLLAVVLPLIVPGARPSAQATDDQLIGIWVSETTFKPTLNSELTVFRDGSNWRAMISGSEAKFHTSGNQIRFDFPGGIGQFRGGLTLNDRAIEGFWVQPPGVMHGGQAFASPLVLRRVGREWRGIVKTLPDRFTLYLKIFRNSKGILVGAFRNPEQNSIGGATQYRVTREGGAVNFSAGSDPAKPTILIAGSFAGSNDRLRIFWSDVGRTVDLTRSREAAASDFFPRPQGEPKYIYHQPPAIGDGWVTARARDVGMDEAVLVRLMQRLIDADPAEARPGLIHSLLVAHHGKLVLDEYFFGFSRDKQHDTQSAGKTFASIMLGAVMKQGVPVGPETSVYHLLARMGPFANNDPRKSQIKLAHLMTHTSGLACNDNDKDSPGNENTMQQQRLQPDWWKYTLDLPMAHDPGHRYAYCSANMNLMGAALTTSAHTWLPELFDRTIARPLQFGTYYWNLMPTGEGYLGGGACLLPRDLLKVGQTYLDRGRWNGRRIVDSSWVTRSTAPHVHISPTTTGLSSEQFSQVYNEGDDGYAWHLSDLRAGERTYHAYGASGNGGQLLIVVPDLDLVVVFTGGNQRQGGIWSRWGSEIIPREIIPAISHEAGGVTSLTSAQVFKNTF